MSPLLRCFAVYRRHAALTALSATLLGAVNAAGPLNTWLFGRALEAVRRGEAVVRLPDGGFDARVAWRWAALMIGLGVARSVAQYLATVLSMVLGQRLLFDLRDRLFGQVQALDLAYHRRHGAGEIIARTTRDSDLVRDAVVGGGRTLIELAAIVVAGLAFLVAYDPWLGLPPALLVIAAMLCVRAIADRLTAYEAAGDRAYDRVTQDLAEGVHGVRVIKAFSLEGERVARFGSLIDGFVRASRAAVGYAASRLPLPQLIVASGHAWVLWYGCGLVARGAMTPGDLVASAMLMMGIVFRVEGIGRVVQVFAEARASAARIVELIDARPAVVGGDAAVPPGAHGLRLTDVRVDGVLAGVDLTIEPGEIVALVGATGSGKSTLLALLPRLRDPDGGAVEIGSTAAGWRDVRGFRLDALRRAVQVVPQEAFLFSDSLAANLRLGAPDATDAALADALRAAAADDVVAGLPDGLASRVGERGATLSGGQRQRVCLARALVPRPALLALDDATSALDAPTEARVLAALRDRAGGAAVLIVASRLATARLADRVARLDGGRIVEVGTHHDLAARSAEYRDLLGIDAAEAA